MFDSIPVPVSKQYQTTTKQYSAKHGNYNDIGDNVNSLAPGRYGYSLKLANFQLISTVNILSIVCEIAMRWMPQHITDH